MLFDNRGDGASTVSVHSSGVLWIGWPANVPVDLHKSAARKFTLHAETLRLLLGGPVLRERSKPSCHELKSAGDEWNSYRGGHELDTPDGTGVFQSNREHQRPVQFTSTGCGVRRFGTERARKVTPLSPTNESSTGSSSVTGAVHCVDSTMSTH